MTVMTLQVMPEEGCLVEPEELQPLLHSTSDSQIRRRDVTIDMEGLGECDTDSNKTEVTGYFQSGSGTAIIEAARSVSKFSD